MILEGQSRNLWPEFVPRFAISSPFGCFWPKIHRWKALDDLFPSQTITCLVRQWPALEIVSEVLQQHYNCAMGHATTYAVPEHDRAVIKSLAV